MNMKNFLVLILVLFFFLGLTSSAQAIALKVSPPEIETEVGLGIPARKEIIVENPGDNVAIFEVHLDNFSNWIKVNPKSFILESGKSKKVILEIKGKKEGSFLTQVSVIARPLSSQKFRSNPGVKIPLNIRVIKREKNNLLASLINFFHLNPVWTSILIAIFSSLALYLVFKKEIRRLL